MKTREYLILEKMLEKNRRMYKLERIEFPEYIENHEAIMKQLKNEIFKVSNSDFNFMVAIDLDDCLEKFRKSIMIVKFNLN